MQEFIKIISEKEKALHRLQKENKRSNRKIAKMESQLERFQTQIMGLIELNKEKDAKISELQSLNNQILLASFAAQNEDKDGSRRHSDGVVGHRMFTPKPNVRIDENKHDPNGESYGKR